MEFYKVRDELIKGKNITELPLRVTFYARVSTDSDEQLNSLDNQIYYFKNYIMSNSNWSFVEGYIDEGLSGSTVNKRVNFLKMIQDSKNNKFDLILTKEVSRFSRNLSDSIKYTQELMRNNVGVLFQSNAINTYDPNSEFILNMMGSVAQEEVKRLSARVKWGHSQAIKKGRVLGSNSITGYKKDNAKLIIDETEVNKVKKIFELYATGNYGLNKLAMELYENGICNSKGKIYDKNSLKRIIMNPKYKGYYRGHTTEVIDYRTKQRIFIPEREQIIFKDKNIPAIVSEELWNQANALLKSRGTVIKDCNVSNRRLDRKYVFSSKLFCGEHNCIFQRSSGSKSSIKPKWACGCYMKYRLKACQSPLIAEQDLNNIFRIIFRRIIDKNAIINGMSSKYKEIMLDNCDNREVAKIDKCINDLILKKEKLLELCISSVITNDKFKERNSNYNEEIEKYKKIKKSYLDTKEDMSGNLLVLNETLKDILSFINIDIFVPLFLNEITVSKIDNSRNNILLDIYLNLDSKSDCFTKRAKYFNGADDKRLLFIEHISSVDTNKIRNQFLIKVYY